MRAVLSVSDKTGLAAFARSLVELGFELVSTGGTAKALRAEGLTVVDVSQVTGFPEVLDGRVKTLHPAIHGGLLARRDHPEDMETLKAHGIQPFDLVVVNLYPFRETAARDGVSMARSSSRSTSAGRRCCGRRRRTTSTWRRWWTRRTTGRWSRRCGRGRSRTPSATS